MPDGPLLLSPDRMATSFYREVIIKKPHLFKIAYLKTILKLFPEGSEPFYAGFGNRDTDALSYRSVNIGLGKIYIINTSGEIKQFNRMFSQSYQKINENVDMSFPNISQSLIRINY
jgi:phosphatidate phosphatase LPIN